MEKIQTGRRSRIAPCAFADHGFGNHLKHLDLGHPGGGHDGLQFGHFCRPSDHLPALAGQARNRVNAAGCEDLLPEGLEIRYGIAPRRRLACVRMRARTTTTIYIWFWFWFWYAFPGFIKIKARLFIFLFVFSGFRPTPAFPCHRTLARGFVCLFELAQQTR